mmetsp:Transcript_16818/g.36438  ORF Transcript_16818/g.36438 Transcript_16818/m.36438 type:complete len:231 (+) Transcript_16818:240-932(+)
MPAARGTCRESPCIAARAASLAPPLRVAPLVLELGACKLYHCLLRALARQQRLARQRADGIGHPHAHLARAAPSHGHPSQARQHHVHGGLVPAAPLDRKELLAKLAKLAEALDRRGRVEQATEVFLEHSVNLISRRRVYTDRVCHVEGEEEGKAAVHGDTSQPTQQYRLADAKLQGDVLRALLGHNRRELLRGEQRSELIGQDEPGCVVEGEPPADDTGLDEVERRTGQV